MNQAQSTSRISSTGWSKLTTAMGYLAVAVLLVIGWMISDEHMIRAQDGLGYWLGIIGASCMLLLLLYPARKRNRALQRLGPVRYWFRLHMVLGIIGPLLVVFHSNFELGSLNSRIALFCTLIVAGSGIIGRYLYAKLHYGLYGRSASLVSLRADINRLRDGNSTLTELLPAIHDQLDAWEDEELNRETGFMSAMFHAAKLGVVSRWRYLRLCREARARIRDAATASPVLADHELRLYRNVKRYLLQRVTLLRKFVQYRVFERLFSLWHIVHYPLFLLLLVSAVIHVIAVHMY